MSYNPFILYLTLATFLLNAVISLHSQQSDIINSSSLSSSNSLSSLSGSAHSVSLSTSNANNIKIIQTSLDDYTVMVKYDDGFIPLMNGPNFANQAYTSTQINSVVNPGNSGINIYDTAMFNLGMNGSVISPTINGKCVTISWASLGMEANDIGVGAQGDVYAAGVDGLWYYYKWREDKWEHVAGDYDWTSITRVDVGSNGTPYVVTSSGGMFYLNIHNEWIKLPGCGTDISVGRGGEIYKIGCDIRSDGFGIYKLMDMSGGDNPMKRNCKCLRVRGFCPDCNTYNTYDNNNDEHLNKYWFRLSGSGVRISVSPWGLPYIVSSMGIIMVYETTSWRPVLTTANARDISISNDNEIFFINENNNIYRWFDSEGNWFQLCGSGKAISLGPYSHPFVIGVNRRVFTASKFNFN